MQLRFWDNMLYKKEPQQIPPWKPPKINMDKGNRPMNDKVATDYNMNKYLEQIRYKYDNDNKHWDLFWCNNWVQRTQSSSNLLITMNNKTIDQYIDILSIIIINGDQKSKEKTETKIRPHSARYSTHYLSKNDGNQKRFKLHFPSKSETPPTPKRIEITKEEINFKEMGLLVHGYIRKEFEQLTIDIIKLILMKCEVLPTFDGYRTRKIERHSAGFRTSVCGNIFSQIECFEKHGYFHGVHYLSIHFTRGGCTNYFGITTKTAAIARLQREFPEILKVKDVKEYKMAFKEYGGDSCVVTIKLDCNIWTVTFYKNYKNIIKQESIKPNVPYFFYMYYCDRARQLFEIITTDTSTLPEDIQEEALYNLELKQLSMNLLRERNGAFIRFICKYLNEKAMHKVWSKLHHKNDEYIESVQDIADVIAFIVYLYKAKVHEIDQKYSKTKEKAKFLKSQLLNEIKHVSVWIVKKYGEKQQNGIGMLHVFKVNKDAFKNNLKQWLEEYVKCNGSLIANM